MTREKQEAWLAWIQAETPDRWVLEDWEYIERAYGSEPSG